MKRTLLIVLAALLAAGYMWARRPARPTVNHADWSRNAVIYEVNLRQYTPQGSLQAFKRHLPRLSELGVDILWFMPIHPISELNRKGELGSYYAVRDYKGVNPEFGSLDDFRAVVKAAHDAGMHVIIDWVPNHTGCDNAWVEQHPGWYARNEQGEMYGPYDWTDVYQLDYNNPEMRAAMIDAMKYWLTEADIDGFRCDVAGRVPVDFWEDCRAQLEQVKTPVFMLAEATDAPLTRRAFDMDYNWPLKDLFNEIAATSGQYTYVAPGETEPRTFAHRTAADIDALLQRQQREYVTDSYRMNMITNHDLNSWEGTEFERYGNLAEAMAVLTYTLPGMPLIYTGQETGLNRALEFFVKDEAPQWEPRNRWFKFYQTLNKLRHERPELASGDQRGNMDRYPTESDDIYVFSLNTGKTSTIVGVNLGAQTQPLKFKDRNPGQADYTDIFTGAQVTKLPATLAPGAYFVYTYSE